LRYPQGIKERSDEAIFQCLRHVGRLLRCARNDGLWPKIASDLSLLGGSFGQEAILDCFQKIIDLAVVSTMTKA
jgi:hypothetical protein